MSNNTGKRADQSRVTEIKSEPASRPVGADPDMRYTPISQDHVDRMSKANAILQEVVWETYDGVYGPDTLLKECKHETMCCPDCEVPGRYDEKGMIVCPTGCGRIISDDPLMVPEDSFNDRCSGNASGDTGKQALNPQNLTSEEPDVQ